MLNRIADLIKIKEMSRDLDEVKINFISNLSREEGREWKWKVVRINFFKNRKRTRLYLSDTKFIMFK